MSDQAQRELALADVLDLDSLDLGELTVTSLRDSVALPETGASGGVSSSSCGSSSCGVPHPPVLDTY
ncbi:thiazolylpeptide-type bacteriocin [Kitasatospora xanthocidica]|uniref:thiazolylpeptide-type bacteriocin n=1 Tax=Kitasatospora xanthocidica TaxID=83382 RepID=UPI0036E08005